MTKNDKPMARPLPHRARTISRADLTRVRGGSETGELVADGSEDAAPKPQPYTYKLVYNKT